MQGCFDTLHCKRAIEINWNIHAHPFADTLIMFSFLLFRNFNRRPTSSTLWCLKNPESLISAIEDHHLQVVIRQKLRTKNPHPRPPARDPRFTLPLSPAQVRTPPVRRRAVALRTFPWTRALYAGTPRRATPPAAKRPAPPTSQCPQRPPHPSPPVPSPQPPSPQPLPPAAAIKCLLPCLLQSATMAVAAKNPRSPRSTKIKRRNVKESEKWWRIKIGRGVESIARRITPTRKCSLGRNTGARQNKNTFLPTSAMIRIEKVCFAVHVAFAVYMCDYWLSITGVSNSFSPRAIWILWLPSKSQL